MKLHSIEAQVHMPVKDGFRVKVSVLDLGIFFNGMLVYPPNDMHEHWVVYPPAIAFKFKRIYPVEFDKKQSLWQEIEDSAIEAVQMYKATDLENDDGDDDKWYEAPKKKPRKAK